MESNDMNVDHKEIQLKAVSVYFFKSNSAYILNLKELYGKKGMSIIIGHSEADAIDMALKGFETSRPLTHDLIVMVLSVANLKLKDVYIYKEEKGVFYSYLEVVDRYGLLVRIDARTSDSVAVALKIGCPIYTNKDVFYRNATDILNVDNFVDLENAIKKANSNSLENKHLGNLDDIEIEKLKIMFDNAIKNELYEQADIINKEIKRRQ